MNNSKAKIYVKREIEDEIGKYVDDPEIIAVVGSRQCGKTTLLKHIHDKLENSNLITFEDVKTLNLFNEDIDSFISQHVKKYDYLFIDEFQYAEEGGKGLKYIYDTSHVKIFITGSSAIELTVKGLKHLSGRVLTFNLYPFSFSEYIRFKAPELSTGKLSKPVIDQILPHYKEFIKYGGYPRVALEEEEGKKKKILEDIYNIYMLRDVRETLKISDRGSFVKLLKALSAQTTSRITYSNLSDITGYSYQNLKEKLHLLEETFVTSLVKPFHTNKQKELVKDPEIFFLDNGLRNSILDSYREEACLHENFVFTELVKAGITPKYWRTKTGAEVDFVIEKGKELIPVEVKTVLKKEKLTKSFISFLNSYKPKKAFFLSKDFTGKRKYESSEIKYYPLYYASETVKEW